METCEYYGGTERVTPTSTKIKCSRMKGGGRVYENKAPEGAMIAHCCWKGGGDCPFLAEDEGSPDKLSEKYENADDGAALEALANSFNAGEIRCPHYANGGSCEAKPIFGGLDFRCEMVSRSFVCFDDAAAWLSCCSTGPEGCIYYQKAAPVQAQAAPSVDRQEKALRLHRQVLANGKIAAECMVAMGRDLKEIRDDRLFTEFGCASFEAYCEEQVGIGKRHGYNFIQVYERFGEEQLSQLQGLGITKLLEIAKLDDEDMQDLMAQGDVAELSVRQLKDKIAEYEKRCEQLTLDLDAYKEQDDAAEKELERSMEQLRAELEAAQLENKQLTEGIINSEKADRERMLAAEEQHRKEAEELRRQIEELQSRNAEAVPMSEEEMEKLREEGRAEAKKYSDGVIKLKEKNHKDALERAKRAADEQRIIAVEAARKQEAAKYSAELQKLQTENAVLQSNAQNPPKNSSDKEMLAFYLHEIDRTFRAARDIANGAPEDKCDKYRKALLDALELLRNELVK